MSKTRKSLNLNESSVQVSSQEHNRRLKRQPESTTEDLEDAGDQENRGDADDDDMNALGAVNEEPVITIGVNGETLDECESVEESYVDVNGGFLDPKMVREARVEELAGYVKLQPVTHCEQRQFSLVGQDFSWPEQVGHRLDRQEVRRQRAGNF